MCFQEVQLFDTQLISAIFKAVDQSEEIRRGKHHKHVFTVATEYNLLLTCQKRPLVIALVIFVTFN